MEVIENEAIGVGLKFVGPYLGVMKKTGYLCHIHGLIYQTPNKVQQRIGCQKCGREKQFASRREDIDQIRRSAGNVGLKYLRGYRTMNMKAFYECAVHGEISMFPSSVRRGCACNKCASLASGLRRRKPKAVKVLLREAKVSLVTLKARAAAVGLEYIDEYRTSNQEAKYRCSIHGEIHMRPAVVRRGGGCRFCSGNVQKSEEILCQEASEIGLEFIGPAVSDHNLTDYRCAAHGIIRKRPGDVKSGKGCRKCAKYGFDPVAPASFYVYRVDRIDGPSFIGYGITKDQETRAKAHNATFSKVSATAELIGIFDLASGKEAATLELHVQRELRDSHIKTGLKGFISEAVDLSAEASLLAIVHDWLVAA